MARIEHLMSAAAVLYVALPLPTAAFSVDVAEFQYAYASVTHQVNFTLPNGFPAGTQDPATGWFLTWNALEVPVTSGAVGNVWRMNTADATLPGEFHEALSSINGVGRPLGYPTVPPTQWSVEARLTYLQGATRVGTAYNVTLGAGDYDPTHPEAAVQAVFFTGDYGGTHYENALALSSSVRVAGVRWDSGTTAFVVPGVVPGAQDLSLRIEVSNAGQSFASFYRLGNAAAWTLAQTYTLPAGLGVLTGFDTNHPYVSIENSIPVPELPAWAGLMLGLGLLGWKWRRHGGAF